MRFGLELGRLWGYFLGRRLQVELGTVFIGYPLIWKLFIWYPQTFCQCLSESMPVPQTKYARAPYYL